MTIRPTSDFREQALAASALRRRVVTCMLCVCLASMLVSCSDENARDQVTLYVSADEHIARQVIDRFEEETGIEVLVRGDVEMKKTTGLVDRIRRESSSPRADVFWNSEVFMTEALANEGLLVPHTSEIAMAWPQEHRHPDHLWHGFGGRARALVYDADVLRPEDVPAHWNDLVDVKYADQIVMADPRFGTTGGHLAVIQLIFDHAQPGNYDKFIDGLARNRVRMLPSGNAGVVDAVLRGEAALGLTDTDDVWAVLDRGGEVGWSLPGHGVGEDGQSYGPLVIPNTVALVRGGPHPKQAAQLADFLLSPEVEKMLALSASRNIPLGSEQQMEHVIVVDHPVDVDYSAAAAARPGAVQRAVTGLGGSRDAAQ